MAARGWLASLVVLGAFVLGLLWLINVLYVSTAVNRCLTEWDDVECPLSVKYPVIAAAVSLVQLLVVLYREVKVEAEARVPEAAAAGAQGALPDPELQALATGQERRRLRKSDERATATILTIVLLCGLFLLLGKMVRGAGAGLLQDYPDDKVALLLVRIGSALKRVGVLIFRVENCLLTIPYVVLRLRRFLREKIGGPR